MPRPEGPFDRLLRTRRERDPAPIIIGGTVAFLAVVLFVIFIGSALLGSDGGGGGGGGGGEGSGQEFDLGQGITGRFAAIPALPPGLQAVSNFIEFAVDEDNEPIVSDINIPLREDVSDPKGLGFYTHLEDRWQRVAEVKAIQNKNAAGDFTSVPLNVAVLRVREQQYQVVGSLPAGGTLHTDADVNILSPRDYTPTPDGSIGGAGSAQPPQEDILFMPTVVGSGADTSAVVNDLLADDTLRGQHADALAALAAGEGIDGVDLEYSSVDEDLEVEFTEFVKSLAERLHGDEKRLSLTLPPPNNQRSAYNWEMLGQHADIIKILPIADPEVYWETMPAAIAQAVENIEPSKVMLVVSPFSIEGTGGSSRPIGYLQAMVQAAEVAVREPANPNDLKPGTNVKLVARNMDEAEGASPIRWDDDSATLSYAIGGTERKRIFIENSFSVSFKLEIVQAYALGGLALSDASAQSDVANVWPAINELVEAATVKLLRPNDTNLLPIWQAPDGGELGAGAGTTATWVPRNAGPHNIILVVSDGERRFGRKTLIEVRTAPEPSGTPLNTFGPSGTPTSMTVTPTPTPTSAEFPLAVQVGKRVDANGDGEYRQEEKADPGATITYRVIIDNDSEVPVKIVLLEDNPYADVTCKDTDGDDVIGQTLAPTDGDGTNVDENGSDAVICRFTQTAPDPPARLTDVVRVVVEDAEGNKGTDSDDAVVDSRP